VRLAIIPIVLLTLLLTAGSAQAASPWWHLTSGTRPANIQPGGARDEVVEVTVSATGGTWEFIEAEPPFNSASFAWNATHEEVQTGLEGIYGKENVEVTGGPGDETASKPYLITFTGARADRRVWVDTEGGEQQSSQSLSCEGAVGGCSARSRQLVKTVGRPDGQIVVTLSNLGEAPVDGDSGAGGVQVNIADTLPPGLKAIDIEGFSGQEHSAGSGNDGPVACSLASLTCTFAHTLPAYEQIEVLIGVLAQGAATGALNEVQVSGGQAPAASLVRALRIDPAQPSFGVEDYEMTPEEEGGTAATQAGSHPFQLTTTLVLNQDIENPRVETEPVALSKDLRFQLPAGLVGNPTAVAQCSLATFLSNSLECPAQSVVGVAQTTITERNLDRLAYKFRWPLISLEPARGEPARYGFIVEKSPVLLDTSVRTGGDYGVNVDVSNITQIASFVSSQVTFWGVPGDARHDNVRGSCLLTRGSSCSAGALEPAPLLTLPTSCTGPLQTSVQADSWAQIGSFQSFGSEPLPAMDGCNRLPLAASIEVAPDAQTASSPTGLGVTVHVPQQDALRANGLAPADVRDTTFTLPAGVALNPAAADGLQACSDTPEAGLPEGQIALNSGAEPVCPEASKVGTVQIKSPLLPNQLEGAAYLAAQDQNPFGSLIALYLVARDPVSGVLVKLAGEVKPDPSTGQLVSTFLNTPQLPFEELKLHFFGGDRAPLATPARCGAYTASASFTPWSGGALAQASSTFDVTSGPKTTADPEGTPCPGASLPFSPSLTGGTTNINAGSFSSLTTTITREDGQQNISQVQLHMPEGLTGLLSGVKLCGETEANAGTCGPESEIGETIVSVGLGGDPFSVTGGKVYITGPYHGAPFGLSIVNPAVAGPFNLGKVIVRAKIEVNPSTAALTITTNAPGEGYAIPHILDGIPLQIKHVNVTIDRPGFTFNPTNCDALKVTGSVAADEGASGAVEVPFQVTNCATLKYTPTLQVSTAAKASKSNGASLHFKIAYPKNAMGTQSWMREMKFDIPRQLPARLTTIQKACLAATFEHNRGACPPASIIGHVLVHTPVLPVPLEGPLYFVSYGGAAFPDAVAVIKGDGITIESHGHTFINGKTGVTSATFESVPDVPFESIEVTVPQGPFSEFGANLPHGGLNFCGQKLTMPILFKAQNGQEIHKNVPVGVTGCKTLTRKQKLAAALKACHKNKNRGKRQACERAARKLYGHLAKSKKAHN